ncbi:O-antigen ligase family protein [bacterium]|nr:MAG: O-antigen ligase family protein [bacterium]
MFALYILLFLAAPLYVWRFSIAPGSYELPANFLMLAGFAVIAAGLLEVLARKQFLAFLDHIKSLPKAVLVGAGLILVASIISLMAFGVTPEKIGQWVVLYAQPLTIFLLLSFYTARNPGVLRKLSLAAYALVFAAGCVAVYQYFTLDTLPAAWQGNSVEPKRAIAFFAHPNAFALFMTPVLAWLIPDAVKHFGRVWEIFRSSNSWWQQRSEILQNKLVVLAWLVGAFGLFLSLSRGAWLGLAAAATAYAVLSANKKVLITFAAIALIAAGIVASVPNLRYRAILPFHGEKSSVARLSLWDTGTKMLADSPVLGKGISGFDINWDKYNTDPNLDHYNFPHNIFLNFWIDLGLAGLVGFAIIIAWSFWRGIKKRKNDIAMGLLLFMLATTIHGLIDIPYLKNDLALVFWMVMAVSVAYLSPDRPAKAEL